MDELIFPNYRKTDIKKSCFIIGMPRSATTYLLNILSRDKKNYTSFKLWEILYAPSVLQKYIFLGLCKILRFFSLKPENFFSTSGKKVQGTFRELHETGLLKPEEDELININIFQSVFLTFFFPGTDLLDDLYYFDETLSYQKRMQIFRFYYRCVQRHCFVFNRRGDKYFISKNPTYIPRLYTISQWFPQSKIIYLLRSPYYTIPSSISLFKRMFSPFTKHYKINQLVKITSNLLINWYKMAENGLNTYHKNRSFKIPFKEFTRNLYPTMQQVYAFLNVNITEEIHDYLETEHSRAKKYVSPHKYDLSIGADKEEIERKLDFIFKSDISNKI